MVSAGSEALGGLPDWGALLADAVGALDPGSLESESARWSAPPVIEPEPAPPVPAPPPVPAGPVQGGTVPEPAPPVLEADGSLTLDTGSGVLSVADVDGDGHLDAALPIDPSATGSLDAGAVGVGSAAVGSAAAGSVGGGSVGGGSVGVGSVGGGSVGVGSVGAGSVGGGSVAAGSLGLGS